jgi:hypothetical protein
MAAEHGGLAILLAPELDELAGLFVPDLARARFAGRLATALARWRSTGAAVEVDFGFDGSTALQTALATRAGGWSRVAITGTPLDQGACHALLAALRELSCPGAELVLSAGDGADVEAALAALAAGAPPDPGPRPPPEPLPGLVIVDPGAVCVAAGAVFEARDGGRLARRTPGPAGSIPAWAEEVCFVDRPAAGGAAAATLQVLVLPERWHARGTLSRVRAACHALAGVAGADHVRLLSCARAAPGARHGLAGGREWDALEALVAGALPERLGLVRTARSWSELGCAPQQEVHGGNGLPDRNAELIVNLVR